MIHLSASGSCRLPCNGDESGQRDDDLFLFRVGANSIGGSEFPEQGSF